MPKEIRLYKVIRYYASPAEVLVLHYSKEQAQQAVEKAYGKATRTEVKRQKLKPRILF